MKFVKYNVCHADYIVCDDIAAETTARSLCDRHAGVGGYGVVFVRQNPFRARVIRPDGSEGRDVSALACAAAYFCEACGTPKISIIANGGIIEAALVGGEVSVSLPKIKYDMNVRRADIRRPIEYIRLSAGESMRAVCPVDDVYGAILFGQGEALSKYLSSSLAYDVDISKIGSGGEIEVKSYEKGVGYITSALGAYAAAHVLNSLGKCKNDVLIRTESGRMSISLGEKPTAKMTVSKILSGEIY